MRGSIAASRKVKAKTDVPRNNVATSGFDKYAAKYKHGQESLYQEKVGGESIQKSAKSTRQSTISSFSTQFQQRPSRSRQNDVSMLYLKHHQQHLPRSVQINGSQSKQSLLNDSITAQRSKSMDLDNVAENVESNGFCKYVYREKAESVESELEHSPSKLVKSSSTPSKRSDSSAEWRIRFAAVKRESYQQAGILIGMGGFLFAVGIMLSALHFAGYIHAQIAGPILLACGLLTVVTSVVWISIIKANLKRREEVLIRTFSF